MANVIFKQGTRAQYNALADKDAMTLYWLTDTQELYKGEVLYGKGTEATNLASGLMSAADKVKLDSIGAGVTGLSAVDASIALDSGENGAVTVGVKVSQEPGNALELKEDGMFVSHADTAGGNGIDVTDNTVSIKLDEVNANGLSVGADGLRLDAATAETAGAMSAADKAALEDVIASVTWGDLGGE